MPTRHLYLTRHGEADPFGVLTDAGRRQSALLGQRLAGLPIDLVWHSPLPRAADSAAELARQLQPGTPVSTAAELIDHVPYVPPAAETPASWAPFFDGYDDAEATSGRRTADSLIARFVTPDERRDSLGDTHEILVTHSYPIAWLVRHALDAPAARWLGIDSANAALTVIELRPGSPPGLVMFNDQGHLPEDLQWTGFRRDVRP